MKRCMKCGVTKPLAELLKDPRSTDGRTGRCYVCHRAYYHAHKTLSGKWRMKSKVCGRCGIEKPREAFGEKRGSIRNICRLCAAEDERVRRNADPDKARAMKARYEKQHPEKRREWEATRRARKRKATVSNVKYWQVLARDGFVCGICGGFVGPNELNIDHMIPLARGGAHSLENLQVAHGECNRRKHAKVGVGRWLYGDTPA